MAPKKRKNVDEATQKTKAISTFFKPSSPKRPAVVDETPPSVDKSVELKQYTAAAKLWSTKLGGELGISWMKILLNEFKKPYFTTLMDFIAKERTSHTVYPPACDVFSWTVACELEDIKVVIIGQDPYHGPQQAHGLCFSVCKGVPPPPSLLNIYKELQRLGYTTPSHGYLMGWARQGVLLLNACLTVRQKEPKSHAGKGWEKLTDAVVHWINDHLTGVVFLLWGGDAQKKGSFINKKRHHILQSTHPSPLSAYKGFIGCDHFKKVNELLQSDGKSTIDWSHLPEQ